MLRINDLIRTKDAYPRFQIIYTISPSIVNGYLRREDVTRLNKWRMGQRVLTVYGATPHIVGLRVVNEQCVYRLSYGVECYDAYIVCRWCRDDR